MYSSTVSMLISLYCHTHTRNMAIYSHASTRQVYIARVLACTHVSNCLLYHPISYIHVQYTHTIIAMCITFMVRPYCKISKSLF